MNNRIRYKDIATGAASAASYSSADKTSFSTLDFSKETDIERQSDGALIVDAPFVQNGNAVYLGASLDFATFERNLWALDGSFYIRDDSVVFWSDDLSDDDGEFTSAPTITATFTGRHTSSGISLVFDSATGDYCDDINIKWYNGTTLLADEDFTPTGALYFCEKIVEAFNKIVITLNKTALPHRRAKVEQIVYGITREFGDDELANVMIINEFDLISGSLPASSLEFYLYPRAAVQYMFQFKQSLEVYHGNGLIGVYYIDDAAQNASNIYYIRATDAVGAWENEHFSGGAYLSGVSAKTLLESVVGDNWEITYDNDVTDKTLYGLLTEQSVRDAVHQICFAWGVCISTDGSDKIRVFIPSTTSIKTLSSDIVYDGASITTDAITTMVRVYAHTYEVSEDGDVEVLGVKYSDTKTSYQISNPAATSNTKTNTHSVESATLVSVDNLVEVTQRVYNYYARRRTVKGAFVWNGEKLGDTITFPTSWTSNAGSLEMMRMNLSGIVRADFEARGTE